MTTSARRAARRTTTLLAAAGVAAAALAVAAPALAAPQPARTSGPAFTAAAAPTTAAPMQRVAVTGTTQGVAAGQTVYTYRLQNGVWTIFPAKTVVNANGTVSEWIASGRVGVNTFKLVVGTGHHAIASNTFTVTVK